MELQDPLIPDRIELKRIAQEHGIVLLAALNLEEGVDIEVYCDIEDYFKAMKLQGASVLYCDYKYYEMLDFLINEAQYNLDEYPLPKQKQIKEKIKNYNTELQNKYDFTRPCALHIRALLPNGKAIQLSFEDNWLEKESDGYDEWIIPDADEAFEKLLFDSAKARLNYVQKKVDDKREKIKETDKIVFEYLMSSTQYNLCTTKESRKQFAYNIISQDEILNNHLKELGVERGFGYYLFVVEVVWKLKKQGITEFDDTVESVMYYPIRESKKFKY